MNTPEFGVRLKEEDIARLRRHGHPVFEDSTILHCTKAFLLDYIRCLEQSYAGALWANDNQTKLLRQLLLDKEV